MFKDPETIRGIAKFQAAHAKMTKEEKAEEIDNIRKQVGMPPGKRDKPESPYEADTTKKADMTKQAAAPDPGDPIEIGNDNNNDGWAHGQNKDDDNILLPRPTRLQGCENNPDDESLFSNKSNDDNDDNDPNDAYSQPSDGMDKKKNSKRKTPTSTIRTTRMSHFSGRKSPAKR